MIIKTIACDMDNSRIYISDKLWRSPKHAIREGNLKYLGMSGWCATIEHRDLYNSLDDKFKITKMWPGEYIETEFEIEDKIWQLL
jgi:hypothetical protein